MISEYRHTNLFASKILKLTRNIHQLHTYFQHILYFKKDVSLWKDKKKIGHD